MGRQSECAVHSPHRFPPITITFFQATLIVNKRSRGDSPQGAAVFIISTALSPPQLPNFLNLSRELASFVKISDNNRNI